MQGVLLTLTAAVLPAVALAAVQGPGYIAYQVKATKATSGASPAFNESAPQVNKRQQDLPRVFPRYGSALYTVDVGFGSTNQQVPLQIDTGSSEIWANAVCSAARDPSVCQGFSRFTMSNSLVDIGSQQTIYAQQGGYVNFVYVADTIGLGSARITKQQFGLALNSQGFMTGVLGLGPWSEGPGTQPYSLLLDNLVAGGFIASPAFSLDISAWDEGDGSLIFGALDSRKFSGELVKLPIVPAALNFDGQYRYYVYLERFELTRPDDNKVLFYSQTGGDPLGLPALINSAMAWSEFPRSIYDPLVAAVLDAYTFVAYDMEDMMRVACFPTRGGSDQGGTFDFTFGGRVIRVPFYDIIQREAGDEDCYIGVREGESIVLGDSFMRAAYAVFDMGNQNVLLAQAADCGSEIVNIGSGPDAVPSITGLCSDIYATSTTSSSTSTATSTSTSTTSSEEPTATTESSPSTTEEPASTSASSTVSSTSTTEEPTTTSTVSSTLTISSTTTVTGSSSTTVTSSSSTESSSSSTSESATTSATESSTTDSSTSSTESPASTEEPTLVSTTDASSTSTVEPTFASTTDASSTSTVEPTFTSTTEVSTTTEGPSSVPSSSLLDPALTSDSPTSSIVAPILTSDVPSSEPSSEPSVTGTEGVSSTVLPIVATGESSTTTNGASITGTQGVSSIVLPIVATGESSTTTDSASAIGTGTGTAAPGVTSLVDAVLTSAASLTTSTVLVTTVYTVTSCAAGIVCRPGAVTTEVRASLTTFCPTASPVAPDSSITLTTTSTRMYTITSCAPKFTACHPGQVTSEVVTGTTVLCADDVSTSAVTKTLTCSLLGQGCAIGEVVTQIVPVTVIPAAAGGLLTLSGQPAVATGVGAIPGVSGAGAPGAQTGVGAPAPQTGVAAPQWTTAAVQCSTCGTGSTGAPEAVLPVGTAGAVPPVVTAGAAKMSIGSLVALLGAGLAAAMFV